MLKAKGKRRVSHRDTEYTKKTKSKKIKQKIIGRRLNRIKTDKKTKQKIISHKDTEATEKNNIIGKKRKDRNKKTNLNAEALRAQRENIIGKKQDKGFLPLRKTGNSGKKLIK